MENTNAQTSSDTPTQVAPQQQVQTPVQQQSAQTQVETPPQSQAPVVPEKYDLKLSEDSPFDPSYLESFQAYAKEQKMTQDQAQRLLEREVTAVNEYNKKQVQEFEKVQNEWVQSIKNDPEVGGEALPKNLELGNRVLKKFAPPQVMELLEMSGYGNNPYIIKMLARIGKAMGEDSMVSANTNSGGKKSFEEVFYGPQNN